VTFSYVEVDLVMRRRHLEDARAEIFFHGAVGHYRDPLSRERTPNMLSDQIGEALVVGMNSDARVSHDRLRTRRGYLHETAGFFHDLVAHFPKLALLRFHDDFLVAEGRLRNGAPVHKTLAAVDVAALEELDEGGLHRALIALVHGKHRAAPVAGGTELAQLVENLAPVVLAPLPGALQESLAADVATAAAFRAQGLLHLGLGSDGRVVGPGQP